MRRAYSPGLIKDVDHALNPVFGKARESPPIGADLISLFRASLRFFPIPLSNG
jgi:hypothetical protein